jgi:hypothetical protein
LGLDEERRHPLTKLGAEDNLRRLADIIWDTLSQQKLANSVGKSVNIVFQNIESFDGEFVFDL